MRAILVQRGKSVDLYVLESKEKKEYRHAIIMNEAFNRNPIWE